MEYLTADLCDAYKDQIKIADPIGLINYGGHKRFHGKIHTLKCYEDHAWVEKILGTDGTGKVLVVDGGASLRCAIMGERLTGIGVKNNWNGVIIYGAIRDIALIEKLNIGVRALGTYPISNVTSNTWEENIEVRFAGVAFVPGHFVYSDEDGIIVSGTELTL